MEYTKQYDVIVVGGGPAGCAAAIAAAREGMQVLLLEGSGSLGGAATTSLVYPFMPNATKMGDSDDENDNVKQLSQGLYEEFVSELQEMGATRTPTQFLTEEYKLYFDRKLTAEGVTVLFHAMLCGVEKEGDTIRSVSVVTKRGIYTFEGKIFVDGTGDADLCWMAGVPTRLGRPEDNLCQPMTLCFRVVGVNKKTFYEHLKETKALYIEQHQAGLIKNPRGDILVFSYPLDGVLHFNTTRVIRMDPTDPFDVTRAEMEAREQMIEMMDFFRENKIPGMEKARILQSAPQIGVRESRMLDGEMVLTQEDLKSCVCWEDSIAAGNYDIDIHNPAGSDTSHYYFEPGTWYTIPYRTLIPKKADCVNLLVGGRCISVTHEAQASVRIMPICFTTGEACGVAAAVAIRNGTTVQEADVTEIRAILRKNGAFLGDKTEE